VECQRARSSTRTCHPDPNQSKFGPSTGYGLKNKQIDKKRTVKNITRVEDSKRPHPDRADPRPRRQRATRREEGHKRSTLTPNGETRQRFAACAAIVPQPRNRRQGESSAQKNGYQIACIKKHRPHGVSNERHQASSRKKESISVQAATSQSTELLRTMQGRKLAKQGGDLLLAGGRPAAKRNVRRGLPKKEKKQIFQISDGARRGL